MQWVGGWYVGDSGVCWVAATRVLHKRQSSRSHKSVANRTETVSVFSAKPKLALALVSSFICVGPTFAGNARVCDGFSARVLVRVCVGG